MLSPTFRFFEAVCSELATTQSAVITREDFAFSDDVAPLIDELKAEHGASSSDEAIDLAVRSLADHFDKKNATLPFSFDSVSGRFEATDPEFIDFIDEMSNARGIGKRSRDFEVEVSHRLRHRVSGDIHRTGWPRRRKKSSKRFREHLSTLGFGKTVLLGKEKDGGLDILWLPPLGAVPHRLIVGIQCKNGEYNLGEADKSLGAAARSFNEHLGLDRTVNVACVLFNDYVDRATLPGKRMNFLPLGLSDLAAVAPGRFIEL